MSETQEILRKQIDNIAKEKNLDNYEVVIVPVSSDGANFMSVNFKAKIRTSTNEEIKLFAKVAQFSEAKREEMSLGTMYQKEITAYTQMLATYKRLQEKYNIPIEDRYEFAEYYAGSSKSNEEIVVMEDLSEQGYAMYDRLKPVTWEYAAKCVENLAKFHALSLAFKREYPNVFEEMFSKDEAISMESFESTKEFFMSMSQAALSILPDELKKRVQIFVEDQTTEEKYRKYYVATTQSFIIHADYGISNALFKHEGETVKSIMIDYQTCRQGSPTLDLLYFIYCSTDEDFRHLHLDQLLDLYYSTFARFLRLLNLDPDLEFSRKAFDEDYKNSLEYGLMSAIIALPYITIEPENAQKMIDDVDDTTFVIAKGSKSFEKRFLPMLNEFIGFGVV